MPSQQLLRYLLVGGTAYVVEISVIYLLTRGFHFSNVQAVAVSFWVGFVVAFTLQKLITFKNKVKSKKGLAKQAAAYTTLAAWNYVFTLILVALLSPRISAIDTRTIAIAIITCWNFLIYRTIFKQVGEQVKPKTKRALLLAKQKRALQRRKRVQKRLKKLSKSLATFKSPLVLISLVILAITSSLWSLLGARLQLSNADALVDGSLFINFVTFQGAQLPSAHSFLLKWPLFLIAGIHHNSSASIIILTMIVSLVTVLGLVYVLYRIDKRPRVFGSMVLALSAVLLLVPAQPHLGGLLPTNFAMLATRNIEYLFYILGAVFVIRTKKTKSWYSVLSVVLFTLLFASDKLFESLALGASVLLIIFYLVLRKRAFAALSIRFLFVTVVSIIFATVLLWFISLTRLTHLVGSSGPYGFITTPKELILGSIFALLGLLTNVGANPVFDVGSIKALPTALYNRLLGPALVPFLVNGIIFISGLIASVKVILLSLAKPPKPRWNAKKKPEPFTQAVALSVFLIASTLAACGVFVLTNHYYPVDSRYLTIVLFMVFIVTANYLRSRPLPKWLGHWPMFVIVIVSIGVGTILMVSTHHEQANALAAINARNQKIADVLQDHKQDLLVGDYWRVVPILHLDKESSDTILPLASCTAPRTSLLSTPGGSKVNLAHRSFTYLLTLDASLTDYPACSIKQVVAAYGHPNASTLIAGTYDHPTELLLSYDGGTMKGHPKPRGATFATILPNTPKQVAPIKMCTDDVTVMNIVAHQDDDLLFMNPDLEHEIAAGNCVRTVYVTAGDAGQGSAYWLNRELGSQAAYDSLAGLSPETVWIEKTIKLSDAQYVRVASPLGHRNITLIFLRLADGNIAGQGFLSSNYESLARLRYGGITTISSVDGQSSYTSDQLMAALTQLMNTYQPTIIHTQAPRNYGGIYSDHSDHVTVGKYVRDAYAQYVNQATVPLSFYVGYPIRAKPENVFDADLDIKNAAFMAYAKFDGGVCQTQESCDATPTYNSYLHRQYTVDQFISQ